MSDQPTGRVVAIIPARYASSRFPGKPLAEIGGQPMIRHVYERTAQAQTVQSVIVATDDERIASAVRAFGGKVSMTSPLLRSGSDRIAAVAHDLPSAEIIVNVQGDEPLIPPRMIDEAVQPLLDNPSRAVGTLAQKIDHAEDLVDPNIVKVVLDNAGRCLYFSRSPIPFGQGLTSTALLQTTPVYRHVGLYVFRKDFLLRFTALEQTPLERAEQLEQLRILEHGYSIHAVITTHQSFAVDTPADLERIRTIVGTHS